MTDSENNNEIRMWEPYDATWLVELAKQQCMEDEPWLPEALSKCTRAVVESEAYIKFYDPDSKPTEKYQTSIELFTADDSVILDIYEGNRVGGAEFLGKIQDLPKTKSYDYAKTSTGGHVEKVDLEELVKTSDGKKSRYVLIMALTMLISVAFYIALSFFLVKFVPYYYSIGILAFLGLFGMLISGIPFIEYIILVVISSLIAAFLTEKSMYYITAAGLTAGFIWGVFIGNSLDRLIQKRGVK